MKEKLKTIYVCTSCGETSPRWLGRCGSCGAWNTMVEDVVREEKTENRRKHRNVEGVAHALAKPLKEIDTNEEDSRILTRIDEMDRVLGGGIVLGSVVLLGGEPGAGKSTMLLQICGAISGEREVLYISGEESVRQIKLRAKRLKINEEGISVAAESNIEEIIGHIEQAKPGFVVIDSIQTMYAPELSGTAGSVSQVRECTARLLELAKSTEIPIFIIGHVNKDGAIAGPKVLEHIVDTVLYFEGDKTLPYRILRAVKNRYGSTNEIGMFDMTGAGLVAISNPSEMLLEGRPKGVSGSCVTCVMEGSRPLMSEIQAIATKSGFGTPRRATSGVDLGRVNLLLAVLEKRAGFAMGNLDIYLNVVGGLELDEPACDLSICLAVVSSMMDKTLTEGMIAVGEVGLGGEIRSVANLEVRLKEAQRIGFQKAYVPQHNVQNLDLAEYGQIQIVGVRTIREVIELL
ncbi:DNA repair protein RadA [Ruminococcaceae bacterium OttesenSCG-928-I18]|nr:DNA repair protein RadA [Ruminococcaceae bacterium OttesenSCG-928-I18]